MAAGQDVNLLHYRPWHGEFRGPAWGIWPVARAALGTLLRRKLFWSLYAAGLLIFLMFFFGNFLLDWAQTQLTNTPFELTSSERKVRSEDLVRMAQRTLRVLVPPTWVTRAFFTLADNHGVLLRGLQRDDETLEELFRRVLNEAGTPSQRKADDESR